MGAKCAVRPLPALAEAAHVAQPVLVMQAVAVAALTATWCRAVGSIAEP